jgi:aspartate/methionine/tyrosine aminotransferase
MDSRSDLAWVRPDGGTVAFPRFVDGRDTDSFAERLLRDHETAVVPGRFFGVPSHFRIAFGVAPENLKQGLGAVVLALQR